MMRKRSVAVLVATGLVVFLTGILWGLFWPVAQVQAGPSLPPRNDPRPTTQPDDGRKNDDDDAMVGAYIELHVQPNQANLWAVVQWQDHAGNWHDVSGWRGALEAGDYQRWWVAPKDFDTGPFHWLVTQGPGGPALGISQPFSLPVTAGEVVQMMVPLK
jgi:hypothetical protein